MAQREVIIYTDDVTGEVVADSLRTVPLIHEGYAYVVDMGPDTYEKYLAAIEPYRAAARRTGRYAGTTVTPLGARSPARTVMSPADRQFVNRARSEAIREWAKKYGERLGLVKLAGKGRIPAAVSAAFDEHGGREPVVVPSRESTAETRPTSLGATFQVPGPQKPDVKPVNGATVTKPPKPVKRAAKSTRRAAG